jgi:RimJ/RimL family protein N-acetyltransferase
MFQRLAALDLGHFYVMGQICIDRSYRGLGLFDDLYGAHRENLRSRYDRVVTEVAIRNARSMRAHLRVGFREILRYSDATDDWSVIAWDWK